MTESTAPAADAPRGLTLALLDKALAFQAPLTDRHIARIRRN